MRRREFLAAMLVLPIAPVQVDDQVLQAVLDQDTRMFMVLNNGFRPHYLDEAVYEYALANGRLPELPRWLNAANPSPTP